MRLWPWQFPTLKIRPLLPPSVLIAEIKTGSPTLESICCMEKIVSIKFPKRILHVLTAHCCIQTTSQSLATHTDSTTICQPDQNMRSAFDKYANKIAGHWLHWQSTTKKMRSKKSFNCFHKQKTRIPGIIVTP